MWRDSSRSFDHVLVSFLWNKENKQDFLPGEKKSNFPFFSLVYLLSSCFLMFLYLCFHGRFYYFHYVDFQNIAILDCWFTSYVFWTFLLIVMAVMLSMKVVHNYLNYYFVLLFQVIYWSICNNWTRTWDLADNEDFILREDLWYHGEEADLERKSCQPCWV